MSGDGSGSSGSGSGSSSVESSSLTTFHIRRSLHRTVIRACTCGAPGVFKHHHSILQNWPRCYVDANDAMEGQPVGDICPQCGSTRVEDEVLPEIVFDEEGETA